MIEFLQAFGVWIVAGVLLVLLILGSRNRGSGKDDNGLSHPGPSAETTRASTGGWVEAGRTDEDPPTKRGSSGCC
jgi:hypothetical protein